jgi:hypothetical protein
VVHFAFEDSLWAFVGVLVREFDGELEAAILPNRSLWTG